MISKYSRKKAKRQLNISCGISACYLFKNEESDRVVNHGAHQLRAEPIPKDGDPTGGVEPLSDL